jgi:hypothetical protein
MTLLLARSFWTKWDSKGIRLARRKFFCGLDKWLTWIPEGLRSWEDQQALFREKFGHISLKRVSSFCVILLNRFSQFAEVISLEVYMKACVGKLLL